MIGNDIIRQLDELHEKLILLEEKARQQQYEILENYPQREAIQAEFYRLHGAFLNAESKKDKKEVALKKKELDQFIRRIQNEIAKEAVEPFKREIQIRRELNKLSELKAKLIAEGTPKNQEFVKQVMENLNNLYFESPKAPNRDYLARGIQLSPRERVHPKFDKEDISLPIQAAPGGVKLGERTGYILSQGAQNYVRKLQLEGKAPPGTFLDNALPAHNAKLNFPVFIGKNGEPIALYNKAEKALGKGAFGEVYLGINIDTGEVYAVKKQAPKSEEQKKEIMEEEVILQDLKTFIDKIELTTAGLEYGAQKLVWGTNIQNYIEDKSITYQQRLHVFKLALEKIDALHKNGYVHRDIKMANLMYDPVEDKVTVIDVGMARKMVNGKVIDNRKMGTKQTMPNEITNPSKMKEYIYGTETDLYSAGIMGAFMLHTPNEGAYINAFMKVLENEANKGMLNAARFKANASKIKEAIGVQFSEVILASDKNLAIEKVTQSPELIDALKQVWPIDFSAIAQNALKEVLNDSNYNITNAEINRQYADATQQNAFLKKLPTHIRQAMENIFIKQTSTDPLDQAINNMLKRMCSDDVKDRPSFEEAIAFFEQVEVQFKLRSEGKLDPTSVTSDFEAYCANLFKQVPQYAASLPEPPAVQAKSVQKASKTAAQDGYGTSVSGSINVSAESVVPEYGSNVSETLDLSGSARQDGYGTSVSGSINVLAESAVPEYGSNVSESLDLSKSTRTDDDNTHGLDFTTSTIVAEEIKSALEQFKENAQLPSSNVSRPKFTASYSHKHLADRNQSNELVDALLETTESMIKQGSLSTQDLLALSNKTLDAMFQNSVNRQPTSGASWQKTQGPLENVLKDITLTLSQALEATPSYRNGLQQLEQNKRNKFGA